MRDISTYYFFFFLMIRRPPRSTLFPTRRSSDLVAVVVFAVAQLGRRARRAVANQRARDARGGAGEARAPAVGHLAAGAVGAARSEEHTSDSSHSQISYAVFCLKKKKRIMDVNFC